MTGKRRKQNLPPGGNKTCRPSDEARAAGWCKIVLSQFIVKAIYCECKLLGQFGDAVDADIEQGSGDNFGLMEVTVPDKLSAFKAFALVVAGEMFAVYGEGAAIKYLQFAALNLFDCGVNSFLSAGCASLAEGGDLNSVVGIAVAPILLGLNTVSPASYFA